MSAAIIAQVTATGEPSPHPPAPGRAAEVAAWAASGAMWLTGPTGSAPLGPPAGLVPKLRAIGGVAADRAAALGGRLPAAADPLGLLGQRAALSGLGRQGAVSCGGATRLLSAGDRWVAVTLARPTDVDLVPAWLEIDPLALGGGAPGSGATERAGNEVWDLVALHVATSPAEALVERARLLGLPVALLPTEPPSAALAPWPLASLPLRATPVAGRDAPPPASLPDVLVADLGSLWAGPLAGALLAAAGARVVKVESTGRADGARRGPAAFFDLLNAGKRSVALDLRSPSGAGLLRDLLDRADVVLEASRPRALEQLGIEAEALLARARPRVWVSITGHGRSRPQRDWTAFGDDAAVAGGLVSWHDGRPCFCADAVADPTGGLVAAAAALDALATGGRWLLDVAMAGVAAHLAGPTLSTGDPPPPAPPPPVPAPPLGRAPALGRHTAAVLAELGLTQ
jgi:crotonobetainyl-CoA:carnitine CoA-transferase CaiB-like acyl-CoA transferase